MDPNANLEEQRQLIERIRAAECSDLIDTADVDRLCDLVQALDGWLASGGFLPKAWAWGRPVRS